MRREEEPSRKNIRDAKVAFERWKVERWNVWKIWKPMERHSI
jgi:hypothetical protein